MTPVRALLAGLIAAVLFGAGLFIATSFAGGRPHDLLPLLSLERTPFSLVCFAAAWGAFIAGALGILAAFLAFIAPEEEDDPRFRRRGFPKAAPLVLIAIALGLAWFALRCAGVVEDEAPVAVAVEPEPVVTEPIAEPDSEPAPAPAAAIEIEPLPAPATDAAAYQWRYKYPMPRENGGALWNAAPEPLTNESENARLLCGKAWVAVTGSASEEGPPARNETRARLRARKAMTQAADWLSRHEECGSTIVFGVDLGQHTPALNAQANGRDDGAASAYQRQILVVSRARANAGEQLGREAARRELEAFLADPGERARLLAGRSFTAAPVILEP